jgi:hypothetical protein
MLVREGRQVLADDEQVKKLFVHDLEIADRLALGIVDAKSQIYRRTSLGRARLGRDAHRILVRIGNPGH